MTSTTADVRMQGVRWSACQIHPFVFPVTGKIFFFLLIVFDLLQVCAGSPVSVSGQMGGLLVEFFVTHF